MPSIELPKAAREALTAALSRYLKTELDLEVTGFDAVFLTDFITDQIGAYYYNQGLADAQALVGRKTEEIVEAIYQLEKPLPPIR